MTSELTIPRNARSAPARSTRTAKPRVPAVLSRIGLHPGLREVMVLAALWIAYSASRMFADDDLGIARERATDVLGIERYVHLDVEAWLNSALSGVPSIAVPMSFWYASLHYLVTPAVLVFIFWRHRSDYRRARNALVVGSAIGLVAYVLIPTAPPRLMGAGYIDTLAQSASYGWWSGHASAPAGLGGLTNELAAMPSLHVGWTVWVAWAMWQYVGRTGRLLSVLYVAGTTLVVVATGNHWVLDAIMGAVVVMMGIMAASRLASRSSARPTEPTTSW
ncbi:phosphatase PAP2 family protein [Aeromicrobium sp. NPDC092404]|uniref:phosphatase PAP2 family protein n=1 Tax=Aeromicrobium sp. NPDC092404 TaxID=3154976 RepID=UPI003422A5FD